jgi:chemotaxis protein methyltransferase CheR
MRPSPTQISPQLFTILSSLVEERTGLHYTLEQRELFVDRVTTRALERGLDSLLDYYYLLRYDDGTGTELQALVETLVVNETFFFRELDQVQAVVAEVLAPIVRQGRRARVWSAACATGEEPLTLAMLLAEAGLLDHVEIVASDLSPRVLERARSGVHSRRSLRGDPPPGLVDRWLRVEDERVTIAPELRRVVDWRALNLVDAASVELLGRFDVVFLRNVLIYFRDETARRVVANVIERVGPGGVLAVGVSESLLRFGTPLECQGLGGVFVYRKRP